MEVVFTFCGSVFSRTVLAPLALLITTREFTLTEREKKQRREQRGRERERARREEVREREGGVGGRAHLFIAGFYLTVWTDW